MRKNEKARALFDQKYNCAQSVLASFAEEYGMPLETAFKIATPFGGGMGHAGQTCGAVSGALMVIGLAKGITVYDQDQKDACYHMAKAFQHRFRAMHGDVTCPGLLGMDIGDPDMLEKVRELDLFHTRCPIFVGDAAQLVEEILDAGV